MNNGSWRERERYLDPRDNQVPKHLGRTLNSAKGKWVQRKNSKSSTNAQPSNPKDLHKALRTAHTSIYRAARPLRFALNSTTRSNAVARVRCQWLKKQERSSAWCWLLLATCLNILRQPLRDRRHQNHASWPLGLHLHAATAISKLSSQIVTMSSSVHLRRPEPPLIAWSLLHPPPRSEVRKRHSQLLSKRQRVSTEVAFLDSG